MSGHAEGYYEATIHAVKVEKSQSEDLMGCFGVKLEDGSRVVATCFLTGKYAEYTPDLFTKTLGLKWPSGMRELKDTIGKTVSVRCKHKDSHENFYLVAPRTNEAATADEIEAAIAKAERAADDDNIPF